MNSRIRAGQIWADKDKRRQGRQLRVETITDNVAQCSIRQGEEGEFSQRQSRIKLDRFSRYQLIKDVEESPESQTPSVDSLTASEEKWAA